MLDSNKSINRPLVATGFESRNRSSSTGPTMLDYLDNQVISNIEKEVKYRELNINDYNLNTETLQDYKKKIQYFNDLKNSGGTVYSMDLETIGDTLPNLWTGEMPSAGEQHLFGVIEAALEKNTWEEVNGELVRKREVVANHVFGINRKQADQARLLLNRFKNGGSITPAEKSTMKTFAKIGASLNSNGSISIVDGMPVITPAAQYNVMDFDAINRGINALHEIEEYSYSSVRGNTGGRKAMESYIREVMKASQSDPLNRTGILSQNGNNFDYRILQKVAKDLGMEFNLGENSIDTYEINKAIGFKMHEAFKGMNVQGSVDKLENIALLPGFADALGFTDSNEFLQHTGIFDTGITTGFLDVPVEGLGQKTIMEAYENRIDEIINTSKPVNVNKDGTISELKGKKFRVTSPLEFKDITGERSQIGSRTLDHVIDEFIDVSDGEKGNSFGYVNKHKVSTLKSNNIYEFQKMTTINRADLDPNNPQHARLLKGMGDKETVYAGYFKNLTDVDETTSVIVRDSEEAIYSLMQEHLEEVNLKRNHINVEKHYNSANNAKYAINDLSDFESGKGFDEVKKLNKDFKKINRAMEKAGIEPNRRNLNNILANSGMEVDGKFIPINEIFKDSSFRPVIGKAKNSFDSKVAPRMGVNRSRIKNVAKIYSYLDTVSPINESIIKAIEVNKDISNLPFDNKNKTVIFKELSERIEKAVTDSGAEIIKDSKSIGKLNKANMLAVDINGETKYINMSSRNGIKKSINKIINADVKVTNNQRGTDLQVNRNLKQIYKSLEERFGKGMAKKLEDLYGINKGFNAVNSLTDILSSEFKDKTKVLSADDLINPDLSLERYKKDLRKLTVGKNVPSEKEVKEIQSKIKALEFVKSNTGVDDVTLPNITRGVQVRKDGKTYKYADYVKNLLSNDAIEDMAIDVMSESEFVKVVGKVNPDEVFKGRNTIEESGRVFIDSLVGKNGLGYSNDEAEIIVKKLFGETGALSKSKNNKDIAATIVRSYNPKKDLETAHLILSRSTSYNHVQQAIKSNSYIGDSELLAIQLPIIKANSDGTRVMEYGTKTAIISDKIDMYFSTGSMPKGMQRNQSMNEYLKNVYRNIGFRKTNNFEDVLKILGQDKAIPENLSEKLISGKGNYLSSIANSIFSKSINSAPTPDGIYTMFDEFGNIAKEYLMQPADYSKFKSIDYSPLIDTLPFLYMENPEVRERFDLLFKEHSEFAAKGEDASNYFGNWFNRLTDKDRPYGVKTNIRKHGEKIHNFIVEEFTVNALSGEKYLEKIYNSDLYKVAVEGMIDEKDSLKMVDNLMAEIIGGDIASNWIVEKEVSKANLSLSPVNSNMQFGDIMPGDRPVVQSQGGYIPIQLSQVNEEILKVAKDNNITTGRTLEGRVYEFIRSSSNPQANEFNKIITGSPLLNHDPSKAVEGYTIKAKMISDKNIREAVKSFEEGPLGEKAKLVEKVKKIMVNADEEDINEIIERSLTHFKTMTTYEQRSNLSPVLSELMKSKFIKERDISNYNDLYFGTGDIINPGDIMGIMGDGKEVAYDGKKARILGTNKGKWILEQLDGSISEVKIASNLEKTVAQTMTFGSVEETLAAQEVWKAVFGEDVNMLSNLELKKHKSSSFAYSELTEMAQAAILDGSDEVMGHMAEKLMNIHGIGNEFGYNKADIVKRYGGIYETNTFIYPLQFSKDEDINVAQNYLKAIDSYKAELQEAYESDGTDPLTMFKKKLYESMVLNKDKNTYSIYVQRSHLEENYSTGVDMFEEVKSKKRGKMGVRDLYFLGKNTGRVEESQNLYFSVQPDGTLKSNADPIRNFFINTMKQTEEYKEGVKGIQNAAEAVQLQAGQGVDLSVISPENLNKYEDVKYKGRIARFTLDEVKLPGPDATVEEIAESIFGTNKDIIRIDLGTEFQLENPLDMNYVTGKNNTTRYLYFGNERNNFVTKSDGSGKLFTKSSSQKIMSDLINNLQQGADDVESVTGRFRYSQGYFEDYIKNVGERIIQKSSECGAILGDLYNQEVNFSGMSLYGGVLAPDLNTNGVHEAAEFNINMTKKVKIKGIEVDAPIDIKYHSDKFFKETLGSNYLEDIGFQLVNKNGYDGNVRFKDLLVSEGILDENFNLLMDKNKETYELIGKRFLRTEGLQGIDVRYPSFNAQSQVVTSVRLQSDEYQALVGSDSAIVHSYTALKLNADTDGDSGVTTFMIKRGEDGRIEMFNRGTAERDAYETILEAQAIDNREYWVKVAKENNKKMEVENNALNPEGFTETVQEVSEGQGNFRTDELLNKVSKAKYDKISIGNASNINLYTNALSEELFLKNPERVDVGKHRDINFFTTFTEQNIISSKYTTGKDQTKTLDKSNRYRMSLETMAKGNVDEGFEKLTKNMVDSGYFDIETFETLFKDEGGVAVLKKSNYGEYVDKFINHLELNDGVNIKENRIITKGMGAIYDLYSSPDTQELFMDPAFRHNALSSGSKRTQMNRIKKIVSSNFNDNTFFTEIKKEVLSQNTEVLDNINKLNVNRENLGSVTENLYFDNSGNINIVNDNTFFDGVDGKKKKLSFSTRTLEGDTNVFTESLSDKDFKSTNKTIDNILTEKYGAVRVKGGDLSLSELDNISASGVNDEIFFGSKMLDDIHSKGLITDKQHRDLTSSMHSQLIEKAKIAKEYNKEYGQQIVKKTYEEALNIMDQSMDQNTYLKNFGPTNVPYSSRGELFENYYNTDAFKLNFADVEIKGNATGEIIKPKSNQTLDKIFDYKAINSKEYINTSIESANKIIDENYAGELSKKQNMELKAMTKKHIIQRFENENMQNINDYKTKVLRGFDNKEIAGEIRSYLGWNNDVSPMLNGLDLTSEAGVNQATQMIETLGEARIVADKNFMGYKASDLSFAEIDEVMNSIKEEIQLIDPTKNNNRAYTDMVTDNYNALVKYKEAVSYVADIDKDPNSSISKVVSTAINESNYANAKLSQELLEKAGDTEDLGKIIREHHKTLIERAKQNRTLSESADDLMRAKGSTGKVLGTIAGTVAAASLISASFGMASKLDPQNAENAKFNQEGMRVVTKPTGSAYTPSNVYMQPRNANANIRAKNNQNYINDENMLNALSVVHGRENVKVTINNDLSNNNNRWFEKEISNYLS